MFTYPVGFMQSSSGLVVPANLEQLIFHDNNVAQPAYYTPQELEGSGLPHDAFLKDYSLGLGDLRPKQLGYCYNFDGVDDYVDCGSGIEGISLTNNLSFSFWLKLRDTSGAQGIISVGNTSGGNNERVVLVNDGTLRIHELGTSPSTTGLGYSLNTNNWYFITAVFVGNNQRSIYVNGVFAFQTTDLRNPIGTANLRIGGRVTVTNQPLKGKLSDVQIYNYALTAQQVADLYAGTLPATKPIAHYPLQEQSGPRAYDISGNGNHGTIMNATTSGVGSIHVADTGVKKSYPNDEGYTPAWVGDGTHASEQLISANVNTLSNATLECKIQTTDQSVILFGNTATNAFLWCWDSSASTIIRGSVGTPTLYVDDVDVSAYTRVQLRDLIADGSTHTLKAVGCSFLSNWTAGLYFSGYNHTSYRIDGAIWDVELNGVPIPGPTLIPNVSDTESAIGTTPQFTGRVPQYGLAKGPAWQGDGSSVSIALGGGLVPSSNDFSVRLYYKHKSPGRGVVFGTVTSGTQYYLAANQGSEGTTVSNSMALRVAGADAAVATGLVVDAWYLINLDRTGNVHSLTIQGLSSSYHFTGSTSISGILTNTSTQLLGGSPVANLCSGGAVGPLTITTGGITTTYSPIQGTRNVAVTKSDGTYSVINNAVVNGTLANLYTTGNGSWRLPAIENGAHWDGTSLIPAAPGAEVAANGNAINIPANKHPRSVLVDRTGAVITPLDTAMGTDDLTNETWEQGVEPLGKRYLANYSDRHGAGLVDVSALDYFEPRAFVARVGTSTSPTSIGTKAVTGVGFQPKVVLPFGAHVTGDGGTTTGVINFGAAIQSAQATIGCISIPGLTTSDTDRRHANDAVFSQLNTSSLVLNQAAFSSFGSDGFALNWNPVFTDNRILNHIALGGTDLEASLTQHNINAAGDYAHGLTGGPPNCLLFFSVVNPFNPPRTDTALLMSLGVTDLTNRFSASIFAQNAATTTNTKRILRNDAVHQGFTATGAAGTTWRTFDVTAVDATNFTVDGKGDIVFALAIRGAKAQVGTFDCNGSLDPLTIATPGITPKLFLPVVIPSGVTNIGAVQSQLMMSIGASDGINNVSCGISDQNGIVLNPATTNARRWQNSTAIQLYDETGVQRFRASASFSDEAVVVTPSLCTTTYGQGGYLILGE